MMVRGRTADQIAQERQLGGRKEPGASSGQPSDAFDDWDDSEDPELKAALSESAPQAFGRRDLIRTAAIAFVAVSVTILAVYLTFKLTRLIEAPSPGELASPISQVFAPPVAGRVQITLQNDCPYASTAFMVKATPSGKTAEFQQNKAVLELMPDERVRLIANTRYPDFQYETNPILFRDGKVTLIADCESLEDRMRATADSLKGAFEKK
ncbi:MAG: hypothetical protein FJY38_07845 [Betaproteobacteria bacterium]|nr:hypothetical protein [Betaproteobacteria bacterium]